MCIVLYLPELKWHLEMLFIKPELSPVSQSLGPATLAKIGSQYFLPKPASSDLSPSIVPSSLLDCKCDGQLAKACHMLEIHASSFLFEEAMEARLTSKEKYPFSSSMSIIS